MGLFSSIKGLLISSISEKAVLMIEQASGISAVFMCQFNPDDFSISTRGKFTKTERKGEDEPIVQFMGGSASSLSMTLYFDTSTSYEIKSGQLAKPKREKAKDASAYVKTLLNLVRIDGKLHRPPVVSFCWGSVFFSGIVESVDAKFTQFEKGGMPVVAQVHLTIVAMDPTPGQNESVRLSPMESPDRSKCILLTEDSSIWDIAQKEYGDSSQWREIARANGILDPLAVPSGTLLRVPALR